MVLNPSTIRPVDQDGGRHVLPSELQAYRRSHRFLGPSCICPAFLPITCGLLTRFTEAAIIMMTSGRLAGHYVVVCAYDRCGYFGKPSFCALTEVLVTLDFTVHLECLFDKPGVQVK